MNLETLHPALAGWFRERLGEPTAVQCAAWPEIDAGRNVLVSAPTGSGKSLAAWMPLLDRMLRSPSVGAGVRVLYISPLRALSRDLAASLSAPLEALAGLPGAPRVGLRTGDTAPAERAAQRRRPPDLLITTPESAFVLIGSVGGRRMLRGVEAVIVDEIHALAPSKRGAHLALSLERLEDAVPAPLQRIGLSATVRPLEAMAAFLGGSCNGTCGGSGGGSVRPVVAIEPEQAQVPDVGVELPDCPLGPFAHSTHMAQIHDRIAELAQDHRAVLVFCRTRGQVERSAAELAARLGEGQVAAHHGSLDRERRRQVEADFKHGRFRVVVSSASLELGLDLGPVDLVCQLGAPGSVNVFRQRAGRACHRPGQRPRARLFPLTASEAVEARAVIDGLAAGLVEPTRACRAPLDVLCQQLVAMVAAGCDDPEALYRITGQAAPFATLDRQAFMGVLECLQHGFVPGRSGHRALVARTGGGPGLAARDDAGRIALHNAGTIPEWFECPVIEAGSGRELGRLDEEFAFESSVGQILQLGNLPWRIVRMRPDRIEVEAAPGESPNLPFWFGDGAGRTPELSAAVKARLNRPEDEFGRANRAALGVLPGPDRVVLERFPDPNGDRHLVIHNLAGARINRAWGLALRKRFCRQFNFELQAAATDDGVLISLGPTHSFELTEILGYLRSATLEDVLIQALLDTPVFQTRFRWCATNALAILRRANGKAVAPQLQRSQTENLLARVFPDQLACLENLAGPRQVPDHPIVRQALADCLDEHMDLAGLKALLARIECGEVAVHAVETSEPSPLARALVHAPRYSFLDPAAAEERRTRAFESSGRPPWAAPRNGTSGASDPARRAWIRARSMRELERELDRAGYLLASEGETGVSASGAVSPGGWARPFSGLVRDRAAVTFRPDRRRSFWVNLERVPELLAVWPKGSVHPAPPHGLLPGPMTDQDEALDRLLLGRIRVLGRADAQMLQSETGLGPVRIEASLVRLRSAGEIHPSGPGWISGDGLAAQQNGSSGCCWQNGGWPGLPGGPGGNGAGSSS